MSMYDINLVPQRIAQRVERGRASRVVHSAALAMAGVALGVAAIARGIDSRSAAQLASARESSAPVIALEGEITALRAERRAIDARLDTQRAVGVAVPASGVVRAIAASLPKGATLEKIDLDYANVQGTNKKIRRTAKDEVPARELRGEIAGIAANDADVGRIVDSLAALAPMSQVSLESSRSREFRGQNAREFRIHFKVDLERKWKLPAIADAQQSQETKP